MKLHELFKMQEELDRFIQSNQKINEDVFRKKGLALLVELAELANETRCFKFWSTKGPSSRAVILEEYVDSIHFLLSLGIEKHLNTLENWPDPISETDLTELFLRTQKAIQEFLRNYSMSNFMEIWSCYGGIAVALEFSYEEVLEAYIQKNQTNYDRQNNGY
ncbi:MULTISPECIES: dUTP diphosphatase [Planococcus]|uniref:dUTPase n=1 Tax=Planococcus kocurii TaxID=1374 RepID=A0AAC8WQW9_9BACL|nr:MULTISPECIES: dUTP diphosphatase [Planococcus]ALS79046.1 dUTPase [Planococcus kocurii]KAA0957909.1 dUTPase [Planococcus sp. ANT_H30]MDJ0330937.1 dUTP diphosphatase [Planococcus sp. S3-L1]